MPFLMGRSGPERGSLLRIPGGESFLAAGERGAAGFVAASKRPAGAVGFSVDGDTVRCTAPTDGPGFYLNGNESGGAALGNGDELQIGESLFRFVTDEEDVLEFREGKMLLCESDRFTICEVDVGDPLENGPRDRDAEMLAILNASGERDGFSRNLGRILTDAFPGARVLIFLWDEVGGSFERLDDPAGGKPGGPVFRISRTLLSTVLAERKAILSQDVMKDARFRRSESLHSSSIHSILSAPLCWGDRILGVVYLDTSDPSREFDRNDLDRLRKILSPAALAAEHVLALEALERKNRGLARSLRRERPFIGESKPVRRLLEVVDRVAATDLTVLIRGETGTGKELVARMIHENSPRGGAPLVCVHSAALSESVLESELFGHEKGAFTGAAETRIGRFEQPDGGTIFLDEIGDIPSRVQVKLLRFIQEKEFERVGGSRKIRVNVRIIAATNRDLERAVSEGAFREDLYYRLKGFGIELPPLRERREDIPLLVRFFIYRFSRRFGRAPLEVTDRAWKRLERYAWPGNVRELEHAVEQALVLCTKDALDAEDFLLPLEEGKDPQGRAGPGGLPPFRRAFEVFERQYLENLVRESQGNVSLASRTSGIDRSHLHGKLKKYGIDPARHRVPEE